MVYLAEGFTDLTNAAIRFVDPTPFNIISTPARLALSAGGIITDFVLEKTVGAAISGTAQAGEDILKAGLQKGGEVLSLTARKVARQVGGSIKSLARRVF